MPDATFPPSYEPADFQLDPGALDECDLVLKGGVTSGVVYPYAILELAKRYRLRSIGGASAGAIAAGFAAAAEHARRGGDPAGFVRLGERCAGLPAILSGLFQPVPRLRPLLRLGLAFTAKDHKALRALWTVRGMLATGAGLGAAAYAGMLYLQALLTARPPWSPDALAGLMVAVLLGALAYTTVTLARLILREVPARRFGICSGLQQLGCDGPALTEWFHESLQHIAFGAAAHRPLTFGDLLGDARSAYAIDFHAMTTNLSLQRPEVIPQTRLELLFDPGEWRELFPAAVMDHLEAVSPRLNDESALRRLPGESDLPVLVGIRMSLSFPVLVQAIPLYLEDIGTIARGELPAGSKAPIVPLWFSDGGITSNFPIHFFDSLLPTRPTFAFSLDDLPEVQAGPDAGRISMPQMASEGVFQPVKAVAGLGGFASSIFASAKDWQDQMTSVLPGQRQRVVRIRLSKQEGGLNLAMPTEVSARLMAYGREAGQLVRETFNFDEHRWRRALVAYEALQSLTTGLRKIWPDYGRWYRGYMAKVESYKTITPAKREQIADRLDSLTSAAAALHPPLQAKFPRPTGRLRMSPQLGRPD